MQAHCVVTLGTLTFSHHFYVLPHQLFPLTLGCDWLLKRRAMIDFDAHKLIVPQAPHIPLLHDRPHVPHLSQVQVALSPKERLISVRQLLAHFPSLALQPTHAAAISFLVQHVIHTGDAAPIHMATCRRSPCWEWGRPPVRKRSHNNLFLRKNLRMGGMKQNTHTERERERHKECLY